MSFTFTGTQVWAYIRNEPEPQSIFRVKCGSFFSLENGHFYFDEEGTELADLSAACIEASKVLGDLRQRPRNLWENDNLSVQVSDESGLALFALNLSVALSPAIGRKHPRL
jgi:hypothetical protein